MQKKFLKEIFLAFTNGSKKCSTEAIRLIATVKNQIVLLKQKQPGTNWFYCTPSGRMDIPGEKPLKAAKRELLEETGMAAKKFFLWKKVELQGKISSNIYFFIARGCEKISGQKLDNGEKIKVSLISFDDYLELSDNPSNHIGESVVDMFKARLDKKYKAYLKKTIFG